MPYASVQEIIADISLKITPNANKEIMGQQLQDILIGMCDHLDPKLRADLTANLGTGNSVGGTDDDEEFLTDVKLEVILRDILTKTVHPTYTLPTAVETSSISTYTYESGSQISPILNVVFTQNDAGSIVTRSLTRNGSPISATLPYTDTNVSIGDGNTIYATAITYAQGPLKNNNLGVPDPIGRIPAGTVNSNSLTYIGKRKAFFGTPGAVPTTSANVRALVDSLLDPQVGSSLIIPIALGSTFVSFAYPATLPDPTSVLYLEFSSGDIKDLFTKTIVNVQGANGYATASYKVFTYEPLEPWQEDTTFKVII